MTRRYAGDSAPVYGSEASTSNLVGWFLWKDKAHLGTPSDGWTGAVLPAAAPEVPRRGASYRSPGGERPLGGRRPPPPARRLVSVRWGRGWRSARGRGDGAPRRPALGAQRDATRAVCRFTHRTLRWGGRAACEVWPAVAPQGLPRWRRAVEATMGGGSRVNRPMRGLGAQLAWVARAAAGLVCHTVAVASTEVVRGLWAEICGPSAAAEVSSRRCWSRGAWRGARCSGVRCR